MKKFALTLALTGIVVVFTLPAAAADNGFYLGVSLGQSAVDISDIDEDLSGSDFSGGDMAFKAFAGYRLLNFLALEASYVDFGNADDTVDGVDGTVEANFTGYDVFAVGMLPLGIADIFAKVGMIAWDADIGASVGEVHESLSADGTDPVYGLGVQFRITSFTIRGEVEYFDIEGAKYLVMYSIGASYTF